MTHIVEAWHWLPGQFKGTSTVIVGQAESFKDAKAIGGKYLYEKYLHGEDALSCILIRRVSDNELVCTAKVVCQKVKWFYPEEEKKC